MTEQQSRGEHGSGKSTPAPAGAAGAGGPVVRQFPESEPAENLGAPKDVPDEERDWSYGGPAVFYRWGEAPKKQYWRHNRVTLKAEGKDAPPDEPHKPAPTARQVFGKEEAPAAPATAQEPAKAP